MKKTCGGPLRGNVHHFLKSRKKGQYWTTSSHTPHIDLTNNQKTQNNPLVFYSTVLWKTRVNVNKSEPLTRAESGGDRCHRDLQGMYASHNSVPFQDGHRRGQTSWSHPGVEAPQRVTLLQPGKHPRLRQHLVRIVWGSLGI